MSSVPDSTVPRFAKLAVKFTTRRLVVREQSDSLLLGFSIARSSLLRFFHVFGTSRKMFVFVRQNRGQSRDESPLFSTLGIFYQVLLSPHSIVAASRYSRDFLHGKGNRPFRFSSPARTIHDQRTRRPTSDRSRRVWARKTLILRYV